MTSEVCMMNRLAVVLAADSAATVSRWVDGKREERYFKGSNKVFQLSDTQPIGLMIFDSADIHNVPWEVILKTFRTYLGKKSFNTVEEYAQELFSYLSSNKHAFFPEDLQNDALYTAADNVITRWLFEAIDKVDPAAQSQAIESLFDQKINAHVDTKPAGGIDEEHMTKAVDTIFARLQTETLRVLTSWALAIPANTDDAVKAALKCVLAHPDRYLNTTGMVFAGFGDHEIFPAMSEFESCGMVLGKLLFNKKTTQKIDHRSPAWLSGFAQSSMTETFSLGISFDAYSSLMVAVSENLGAFADTVAVESGGAVASIADLASLIQATKDKLSDAVLAQANKEHSLPLKNVLKYLPVEEMAELAETLITLQSLKERMTKPSETVGGPVDVAIITKHEGLVWIKRKHFFKSDLNSRYALRQAALLS